MEIAVLGLGCFWGPEIKFSKLEGIIKTEVGYCGGDKKETNYREVCEGNTNHAEVVKLDFDPNVISYERILEYFFEIHDPTTLNSQGPDFGTQYRSEIFYLLLHFPSPLSFLVSFLVSFRISLSQYCIFVQ